MPSNAPTRRPPIQPRSAAADQKSHNLPAVRQRTMLVNALRARKLLDLRSEYLQYSAAVAALEQQLMAWHKSNR